MVAATTLLERMLQPFVGDMPLEYARKILSVDFTPEDLARHRELAAKSQLGTLTYDEQTELHDLVVVNDLLTILHAKAQLSLNQSSAA
jgi:hypothetical protein